MRIPNLNELRIGVDFVGLFSNVSLLVRRCVEHVGNSVKGGRESKTELDIVANLRSRSKSWTQYDKNGRETSALNRI